eukprot:m.207025 g.207025  ORF g.207025 m.207025 type:complete len:340 (+) comp18913_c0_seq3:402-1421(+)
MPCPAQAHFQGGATLSPLVPAICLVTMNWGNTRVTKLGQDTENKKESIRNETRAFVYSAIASDPGPLHFVFVTEAWNREEIPKWFECCDSRITYNIVPLKRTQVIESMQELQIKHSNKAPFHPLRRQGGVGRSAKFFLTDLLGKYKRVMFWDTDVVMREPISTVWKEFDNFKDTEIFAATRLDDPDKPHRMGTGLCSCLMLLDLERMRAKGWTRSSSWLINQFKGEYIKKKYAGWGDQALFSVIERNDPSLCKILDHHFMLNRCQRYYNVSDPKTLPVQAKQSGSQDWGALHFNCADMPDWETKPRNTADYIRAYVHRESSANLDLCKAMDPWFIFQDP